MPCGYSCPLGENSDSPKKMLDISGKPPYAVTINTFYDLGITMAPTKNRGGTVIVAAEHPAKKLTAAQKQFNSLSKRIDKQKQCLHLWQQTIPAYRQKFHADYLPLLAKFDLQRLELVRLLDRHHDNPLFKKTDKKKISFLIKQMCGELLDSDDLEEAKALFNKYNEEDYDTLVREQDQAIGNMMKQMAKQMFGVELDDDVDVSSPEKLHGHVQEQLRLQQAERQATQEPGPKPRAKTKKQLEREARLQEEEALASKSVQEVYRKLVAALHPDREPDAAERQRKTELMQKVNAAYGKKDLLQLLELQLHIEQIDMADLSQMADSRLKYFNKILKEQCAEMEQEILVIEESFKVQFDMPFHTTLSPQSVLIFLQEDISQLKESSAGLKNDLALFSDALGFKSWLKGFKLPRKKARRAPFDLDGDIFPR